MIDNIDYKGIGYLRQKLASKRTRVQLRYDYYEMKDRYLDRGITIPPSLRNQYMAVLGWCAKAVDTLADRLVFDRFDADNFDLTEIYQRNNSDILFDSAVLSAMISSCAFIYISPDADGYPRLQVIDGSNATGIMDPITNMLLEGYAVLKRNQDGVVITEAYFKPGVTYYYTKGESPRMIQNQAPYPLLVPIIYRPDARRPFGHSRISRACMYFQRYAKRTLERSDIAAEFYSFPQKYVLGTDPDAEPLDKWKATIASMLEISSGENGEKPSVGQFSQASMSPYTDQLKTAAAGFAGETGLTLDDLGFVTDNPSSADAIKASHETLRVTARKAQRSLGVGFLNAGYLAACLRDDFPYRREQLYLTTPKWHPVFEPDAAMLSGIGDGAIKINQAIPGYMDRNVLRELTGIEGGEAPSVL